MATSIFIGIAVLMERHYTISQSASPSLLPTHPVPASSIPSNPPFRITLFDRFRVCRLAPMLAKASELNRPVLFYLYLAGTIDTWRATGATMPSLARSIYRSRGITCEPAMFAIACALRACLRSPLLSASSSVEGCTSAW